LLLFLLLVLRGLLLVLVLRGCLVGLVWRGLLLVRSTEEAREETQLRKQNQDQQGAITTRMPTTSPEAPPRPFARRPRSSSIFPL